LDKASVTGVMFAEFIGETRPMWYYNCRQGVASQFSMREVNLGLFASFISRESFDENLVTKIA
jgi:hypothetical protein